MESKLCRGCNETKSLIAFGKDKYRADGLTTRCKSCRNKQNKQYYIDNPEKLKAKNERLRKRNKNRYHNDPEYKQRQREHHLKRMFGIDHKQYERMYEEQCGKCKICGTTDPKGRWNHFAIDHCHKTGKIRGLLCGPCNKGLGSFQDNPKLLKKALSYLFNHE